MIIEAVLSIAVLYLLVDNYVTRLERQKLIDRVEKMIEAGTL